MENYSTTSTNELIELCLIWLFLVEFVIGIIQLIGAIIRTVMILSMNKPIGQLKIYWIMVLVYFSFFGVLFLFK